MACGLRFQHSTPTEAWWLKIIMTDLMALSFMASPKSNNVGLLWETENEISSHRTICFLLFFHKDHRSFKVFLKQPESTHRLFWLFSNNWNWWFSGSGTHNLSPDKVKTTAKHSSKCETKWKLHPWLVHF
jgi:hypothetical protein